MLDDFIFRGQDIAAFGATAAFGESMTVGSGIKRCTYALPGGASLELGEPSYSAITRTVTLMPLLTADYAWVRRLLAWLTAGRGQLIVKHSPDTYRIASFDQAPTYGAQIWPEGGLQMRMTLLPLCHAARETVVTGTTTSGEAELTARFDTALPSPVRLSLTARGAAVTAVEIVAEGRRVACEGLKLADGQTLIYDAGDAHQGRVAALTVAGALNFGVCTAWDQLTVQNGGAVHVRVTGAQADVALSVRGRYTG